MTSNYFWQYIAGYTVANLWRYPIRHRITKSSALELSVYFSLWMKKIKLLPKCCIFKVLQYRIKLQRSAFITLCLGVHSNICLFDLILYVPLTSFQLNRYRPSWVEPVLSLDKCVLLKDHDTVTPVRLKPAAPLSWVKHSTTKPLPSHSIRMDCVISDSCYKVYTTF